jgi:Recombinase/Recombinase zinc beta ribbon domain
MTEAPAGMIPVVFYAAKSTKDKHLSIPGQFQSCEEFMDKQNAGLGFHDPERYQGERSEAGRFKDEGFTAYTGNRGPGLVAAEARAAELAGEYGRAELVVQHTDRLARGAGDKPGAAQSGTEVWHRCRRRAVHIRSAWNDSATKDEVGMAIASKQAHEESKRKSEGVTKGLQSRVELHKLPPGGRLTYGYRLVTKATHYEERVIELRRPLTPDEERDTRGYLKIHKGQAGIVRRIFHWWVVDRMSQNEIARRLNAEGASPPGKSTIPGRPPEWRNARIGEILRNRFYLGEVNLNGEWHAGSHKPIIDPGTFAAAQERLAAQRGGREPDGSGPPLAATFLLNGLMWCGECGGRMGAHSGHGTYRCSTRSRDKSRCSMPPIKREHVDPHVMDYFEIVGFDREATLAALKEGANRDLAIAQKLLSAAENERAKLESQNTRMWEEYKAHGDHDDWARFKAEYAEQSAAVDAQVERYRRQVEAASSTKVVDAVEEDVVARLAGIRRAAAEGIGREEDVAAVRTALRRLFDRFILYREAAPEAPSQINADLWIFEGSERRILDPVVRPGVLRGVLEHEYWKTRVLTRTHIELSAERRGIVLGTAADGPESDPAQPPGSRW